jgi:hypothetical protein
VSTDPELRREPAAAEVDAIHDVMPGQTLDPVPEAAN